MLSFVAKEFSSPCSALIDLLSLPVDDRKSVENTNLIAISLHENIFFKNAQFQKLFSRKICAKLWLLGNNVNFSLLRHLIR